MGNSTTSSNASHSSLLGDSSNRKRPHISGQDKFCDKRVKFRETLAATGATVAPTPSHPTLNLAALEALQNSGAIEVIFPRSLQSNNVKSQPPSSKHSEKYLLD